jgi:hypothetical protein
MLMEMAVKSMETVVESMESMETAPGALPYPSRVPEQRLLSPEISLRWRRRFRTLLGKTSIHLGFGVGRLYISREAASEVDQGAHTTPSHGQGGGAPALGVAAPRPPLRLSFGLHLVSGKNRRFGLRFVQFREYFLCSFSETKK